MPNLSQVPVDDRVDAHEVRPAMIGAVKVRELGAVRVGAPGTDEDCLDFRMRLTVSGRRRGRLRREVGGEGVAEGDALCGGGMRGVGEEWWMGVVAGGGAGCG